MCNYPADTLCNNDVVITSKRRHFDVITSKWRRFDVITTLSLRHVFTGYIPLIYIDAVTYSCPNFMLSLDPCRPYTSLLVKGGLSFIMFRFESHNSYTHVELLYFRAWWRLQMETFSRLNKHVCKQPRRRRFEMPSCSLTRQCNE